MWSYTNQCTLAPPTKTRILYFNATVRFYNELLNWFGIRFALFDFLSGYLFFNVYCTREIPKKMLCFESFHLTNDMF